METNNRWDEHKTNSKYIDNYIHCKCSKGRFVAFDKKAI